MDDNGCIDISAPPPALIRTSRFLHDEYLPIWLGNNWFKIVLDDHSTIETIFTWLVSLGRHVSRINKLFVRLSAKWLRFETCGTIFGHVRVDHNPTAWEKWDELIFRLSRSGLHAEQVVWSTATAADRSLSKTGKTINVVNHIFNDCVLVPLLRGYGFYLPSSGPENVLARMARVHFMPKLISGISRRTIEKIFQDLIHLVWQMQPAQDRNLSSFITELIERRSSLRQRVNTATAALFIASNYAAWSQLTRTKRRLQSASCYHALKKHNATADRRLRRISTSLGQPRGNSMRRIAKASTEFDGAEEHLNRFQSRYGNFLERKYLDEYRVGLIGSRGIGASARQTVCFEDWVALRVGASTAHFPLPELP